MQLPQVGNRRRLGTGTVGTHTAARCDFMRTHDLANVKSTRKHPFIIFLPASVFDYVAASIPFINFTMYTVWYLWTNTLSIYPPYSFVCYFHLFLVTFHLEAREQLIWQIFEQILISSVVRTVSILIFLLIDR